MIGKSAKTIKRAIVKNEDFPIVKGGSNGVPYVFDLDRVTAWYDGNAAKVREADEARRKQLTLWRAEHLGGEPDPLTRPLTAAERKAEYEAALVNDRVKKLRGQLG